MITKNLVSALGVLVVLCACDNRSANSAAPDQDRQLDDLTACRRQGGEWRRVCLAQEFACVTPYKDGGKPCSDPSQCEGECVVDLTMRCAAPGDCKEPVIPKPGEPASGVCELNNDPCGSIVVIRKGRAEPILHRD